MLILCVIMVNYILLTNANDAITTLITEVGYPAEVHTVTTEDSYILNIHRITPSKCTSKTVIIMHGLLCSSAVFLMYGHGLQKALVFKLADNDYDVWLANARGTEFSRNHKYLQPTSEKFWNFSFNEIAKYDLPAIIDYILKKTNNTNLHYVGHSQGTTVVMAMLSMLPQYNKKLKTVHLMAPAIYFTHAVISIKTASMFSEPIQDALTSAGFFEFPSTPAVLRKLVGYLCSLKSVIEACKRGAFALLGPSQHINDAIFNRTFLTNTLRYFPGDASVAQFMHFAQMIRNGGDRFVQFNYRKENNLLMYNQTTPPNYQLSNVRTKIHILYGTTDYITAYEDAEKLIKEFKPWTIGVSKLIGYNHMDFVVAKDLDESVNVKILNLMNLYN